MRRVISLALAIVFASFVSGTPNLIAQQNITEAGKGGVEGVAQDTAKNPLANHTVRLTNTSTKASVTATSAANGTFAFPAVTPGSYVIQILDAAGQVIGTSSALTVAAGAVTTLTVTAGAVLAAAAAAGGTAGVVALFGGVAPTLLAFGIVAGVVLAVVATQDDASPSR